MSTITRLLFAFVLLFEFCPNRAWSQAKDPVLEPGPEQIPEWLQQGRFRFARLDGGPLEVRKTTRSEWGKRFTPQETDVLGNLYGKHADQIADLLVKANVNFVWVTYSVGFSWDDEAEQRELVRNLTRKLHERGIKVAAYMCAVSVFWESMFRDVPESVKWIRFDEHGVPFRYSGGRDPLRFIADLDHPGWVNYQEKRVGAIIDDGLDAIFFDNTGGPGWANNESVGRFFDQIRTYIHKEKHSDIPLFTNYGLPPSRAVLNRNMEFTFNESWREPGVWENNWEVSNVRRFRLTRGEIPSWKPLITEYSIFHQGDRASTFLSPHSERLAIAEAAAFGGAYTWDMEGPFDERLISGDARAMASWAAIGECNNFLKEHEALYIGARNVAPILVLIPDDYPVGFGWDKEGSPLFDLLARNSVLFEVKSVARVTGADLKRFEAIAVLSPRSLTGEQSTMIGKYQAAGGRVCAVGEQSNTAAFKADMSLPELSANSSSARVLEEVVTKLRGLTPDTPRIELAGPQHVLANLTSLRGGQELALHLLNYNPNPVKNVQLTFSLGKRFSALSGKEPTLISADADSPARLEHVRWKGTMLEATVPSLTIYSVLVFR